MESLNQKDITTKKTNFAATKNELETNSWQNHFLDEANNKSTEELWKLFKEKVTDLRNRFVPLQSIGGQKWRKVGRIPIQKELREKIAEKRRSHRKWMKSSPRDKDNSRAEYIVVSDAFFSTYLWLTMHNHASF